MQHPSLADRSLALRLRRARLAQHRKLIEVAASIGISETRLVHYEMARRRPSAEIAAAWERTLR